MNNPHEHNNITFVPFGEDKRISGPWADLMEADVSRINAGLIFASICVSGEASSGNIGFRFVDRNTTLSVRSASGKRTPVHFSHQPEAKQSETQNTVTYFIKMDLTGVTKLTLQIRVDDSDRANTNSAGVNANGPYNHQTISTLTIIPTNSGGMTTVAGSSRKMGESYKKVIDPNWRP